MVGHTCRQQLVYPRLAPYEDELPDPGLLGRDKIQVRISDCKRLIRARAQLFQGGKKGLRIGFECSVIAA
jgi:hypothetical protein